MAVVIQKNFGLLLEMAQKDVSVFIYILQVLGEGFQSMQSMPLMSAFDAVSFYWLNLLAGNPAQPSDEGRQQLLQTSDHRTACHLKANR